MARFVSGRRAMSLGQIFDTLLCSGVFVPTTT